jgi:hypothetical protein
MGKVLHASYSGYFPTCISDGTPSPSQNYLSLTLEGAMAMFWKVKTWEARASGSFYSENINSEIEYNSNSFSNMTPSVVVSSEESLVCKGEETFDFERAAIVTITPDGEDPYVEDGSINFQFIFSSIARSGSTYYPSFYIASVNALTQLVPTFGSKVGTYKITYSGLEINGDLFGPDGSSGSALIEINAKEYWSYGGTYNTSNGSAL